MSLHSPIRIVQNGLMLYLDSANIKSFSLNGGLWYDLTQIHHPPGNFKNVGYSYINLGAMIFNGTTSYVELPVPVLNNYTSGTICCWVNLSSVSAATITARQYDGTGTYAVFSVGSYPNSSGVNTVGTSGKLYWHGKNGVNTAASTGTISANSNNFICVTFNGSKATFYINGRFDSDVAGDYSSGNSTVLSPNYTQVGAWNNSGTTSNPTNGNIYSLLIYNRALSPDEILQNYDSVKTRYVDLGTGTTSIITTTTTSTTTSTTTTAAATTTTTATPTTTTTAAGATTTTTAAGATTTTTATPTTTTTAAGATTTTAAPTTTTTATPTTTTTATPTTTTTAAGATTTTAAPTTTTTAAPTTTTTAAATTTTAEPTTTTPEPTTTTAAPTTTTCLAFGTLISLGSCRPSCDRLNTYADGDCGTYTAPECIPGDCCETCP